MLLRKSDSKNVISPLERVLPFNFHWRLKPALQTALLLDDSHR
jgi:hypothetical protein